MEFSEYCLACSAFGLFEVRACRSEHGSAEADKGEVSSGRWCEGKFRTCVIEDADEWSQSTRDRRSGLFLTEATPQKQEGDRRSGGRPALANTVDAMDSPQMRLSVRMCGSTG
nr:uncharacterized protein LOC117275121 [Nicotiana tomentosiformis]